MSIPSSKANNRTLKEWFDKLSNSEIRLPRFQRPEAWDRNRVSSLMNTVIHNLPLGITLVLEVDKSNEPFISRELVTAPNEKNKVTEHLLDGQQRLTAFWKALHNNYEGEKYFVYWSDFDSFREESDADNYDEIRFQPRWYKKNTLRPIWADIPKDMLLRGLIPLDLFIPEDNSLLYEKWVKEAIIHEYPEESDPEAFKKLNTWNKKKDEIIAFIRDKKEIIKHYNLPYLALPITTPKDTALQVFINMNTNSKPLSQYDIIRAEIEGVKGISLDDYQNKLNSEYPEVQYYFDLPFLILATSALMQDKLPNQRGMWDMQKDTMVENWNKMCLGLSKMAAFLESQGIYDKDRLPTNAVLAVISALYTIIPENLDAKGKAEILLKKYLWSSFFTDRYENSAASNAYSDFVMLKRVITGELNKNGEQFKEEDVPTLNRDKYPLSSEDEMVRVSWPKRENIRARAIMAVFSKLGAYDFADGTQLNRKQLIDGKRHYHHVFPDALLKEFDIDSFLALNCALITDKTNLNISNKEPFKYLSERYEWVSEDIVDTRLKSHLIPIQELKNGGYEGLSKEEKHQKVKFDFEKFIEKRAAYVFEAVQLLVNGRDISANEIIKTVDEKLNAEEVKNEDNYQS